MRSATLSSSSKAGGASNRRRPGGSRFRNYRIRQIERWEHPVRGHVAPALVDGYLSNELFLEPDVSFVAGLVQQAGHLPITVHQERDLPWCALHKKTRFRVLPR